ncbi:peptidase T [[Eubacterium] cellulosolvens]
MEDVVERFLRYVKIDTQSKEGVEDRYPSTKKQKDLGKVLVKELKEMGLEAELDKYGYVFSTLPANTDKDLPVIGLIAHMDTSPDASGANVKPQVITYNGGDLEIGNGVVLLEDENPELKAWLGKEIITTDGSTLLGADDKAGVAEIMAAIKYLLDHPVIKHGTIKIGFTPDEEVGNGTKFFNVEKFGARYAYTIDGGKMGEVENETFNASSANFKITGIGVHPGSAKGKMVNAIRIISELVGMIPQATSPETTEAKEGYLHVHHLKGEVDYAEAKLLIRDFTKEGMENKKYFLGKVRDLVAERWPKATIELEIKDSYSNMIEVLSKYQEVVDYAIEATKMANVEPIITSIRGGTDGARLCFEGLPTPNIYTGGLNYHGIREWIPIPAMEKAVETIVNLIRLWHDKNA